MDVAVLGIGRDIAGALGNPSSTAGSGLGLYLLWWYFGWWHTPVVPKTPVRNLLGNEKADAQIGDRRVYRGVWFLLETDNFWSWGFILLPAMGLNRQEFGAGAPMNYCCVYLWNCWPWRGCGMRVLVVNGVKVCSWYWQPGSLDYANGQCIISEALFSF